MEFKCIAILALLMTIGNINANTKEPLKMNKKGAFRILQMTDTHFGRKKQNLLNIGLMTSLLTRWRPDFSVISGDLVSGYDWNNKRGWYENQWRQCTLPYKLTKTKYAVCLGNHDSQADLNRTQIMQLDQTHPYSYSQHSPSNVTHASNYYLPVYSRINPGKVAAVLWFLDSGDSGCDGGFPDSWGCVQKDQVSYFDQTHTKVREMYGDDVLTIAFIHIPIQEFITVYDTQPIHGRHEEGVCCPQINTGMFQALVQHQVRAVFSGHDHNNDYHGFLEGVDLVYGRQTGFGGYGPPITMRRGGRLLTFKETFDAYGNYVVTFDHVIVTSDGRKVKQTEATIREDQIGHCPGTFQSFDMIPQPKKRWGDNEWN